MTIQTPPGTAPPVPPSAPVPRLRPDRGRWALSWHGVRTVARLELRQRVRSSRWQLMLGLFFVTIGVLSGLTMWVSGFDDGAGDFLYGAVAWLVLTLGLLVAPSLTSTSVNGDRGAGTLAPLQMTLLTPAEIAVGKLLAGWLTALAFLGTGVPFLLLAMVPGGTGVGRFLVTTVMMALVLLAVCAIAIGWSALTARSVSSAVMTYLTTAFLCIGTLILFGLSVPLVTSDEQVRVLENPPLPQDFDYTTDIPVEDCVETTAVRSVTRTDATWWLLAANPYVVVADAAPGGDGGDAFFLIKTGVRTAQAGPREPLNECWASDVTGNGTSVGDPFGSTLASTGLPVWPFGLVINLGLGALGIALAVRRLSTPVGRLPRGTRIA